MKTPLSRRAVLGLACALWLTRSAPALALTKGSDPEGAKIRTIERTGVGVTLRLELASAPFPVQSASYQDASVHVFVPSHFRAPRGPIPFVVHFHGHNTSAERALGAHKLREQLFESKQNAILIVPQGPLFAADSSAGKLEQKDGLAALLRETLRVLSSDSVATELGASRVSRSSGIGRVCLSAHSGGYHAAAMCAKHGGVPVSEIYLFDALYADADVFKEWMLAGRAEGQGKRKLVTLATGGAPAQNSDALVNDLTQKGFRSVTEKKEGAISREDLVRAEVVFLQSPLTHQDVTFEHNALRDCLFASNLPRRLPTSWFRSARGPRPIEKR